MSDRAALPEEADRNQARASDPSASAWVSASAGTGKTAVLVKRVQRLLLAGFKPESILCLTYTKTAAAEMQNRLLKELAAWATISEDDLRERLQELTKRTPEAGELREARRLFARTLEAKGGLKIYTIHGFCERLLQRFPLEARVTPHFSVLDEPEQALLRRRAFDAVFARAAEDREGALGQALAHVITLTSESHFRKVIDAVLAMRGEMARIAAYHGGRSDWAEREAAALKRLLGVHEVKEEDLIAEMAGILSDAEIGELLDALEAHGATKDDARMKASLINAKDALGESRAAALKPIFCTVDHEPRQRLCSKALKDAVPRLCVMLERARDRFVPLDATLAKLRIAEASGSVLILADAVMGDYERRKRAEAALDYDDLIVKTLNLLLRERAAAWVLYKIDGGIDHILVDEAQDTNPAQWDIIERLAEEFFAGAGASERTRTIFAVGDEKQSIYSFQGADPRRFGEIGRIFQRRAEAVGLPFHQVPLNLSFRSTEPVLRAVDAVFANRKAASGLVLSETAVIQHHAVRKGEAGLVELWLPEAEAKPEPADPFAPWEDASSGARSVDALCQNIARLIRRWIEEGEPLLSAGRPVKPGDILILVRRRDPFTTPMIRALKRERVPVAGADRMKLMDQLAVQDLVALADVLLLPEDDLALAVVLKSPLFGLSDDDLFDLAHGRGARSLWSMLKDKAETDRRFAEARATLKAWLARTDFLPPYEFFADVLGADGQKMRERMLIRLGPEAAEAIDEFLDHALAYDRDAAPSLQGFIDQLRKGDIEIKRDMDQDRDEVRIMTVHGAKGLQAPIVFLPDTCMNPRAQGVRLYPLPRPGEPQEEVAHIVWAVGGRTDLEEIEGPKEALKRAEHEEHHRLLYVAMTRAQDRLYVCGWQGQKDKPEGDSWYELIKDGLGGLLAEVTNSDGTSVRRMDCAQVKPVKKDEVEGVKGVKTPLPAWALRAATPERAPRRLTPSRLPRSPVEGTEAPFAFQPPLGPLALAKNHRFARGRLVHALLQYLPEVAPEDQERAARTFIAARGRDLAGALQDEILAEAVAIVRDPRFAPLFRPGSLAEVPVIAKIGDGKHGCELEGQIDRLAILAEELLILDYKTNRPPPKVVEDVAPAYIDQLAAYRIALKRMFPGKILRAALLWTDGPNLMEIPSTSLDLAEARILGLGAKP
ncbi:double-strand break repair helicase AddA [Methyloceanibacter sp.]|uniref:double-strand break repair helicase AddA n=1 Tax=Methyloceanibacter sp. TaxID=1965321 RepID=UPI002D33FEED|nr:double-strand break repair helicase AddA [Methyloceanibacter sp.]HZP10634.1 double-strand break repair helicase AddA [Methyloceanibacter sp.]